ncbi:class I SAM-dependent methyltransferase [Xanthomonas campestris pv. campestris]|uniref:Methyltransferase n=1 Tax=Xanthomonas campestris pv. campestris (strain B100) TaxID=509169 RepID=B0RUM4_XANCB|nr:class I SAM-dependent methyltransferase [Xanthomonas campestris]MDO0841531.1 class I SAM-dependent methyltransferase [Xanthomonas campestris pv. campestris]MEA0619687.1 class I SAM-dependent methyltransferase [Xanthomonas campestris pv. campestris]MEA0624835.1 class I SAM-dependent methyltransferase [Xanthomonas campestris pv. campestris]MEA0644359.1 class I SAM-dependent methyltransferase [Xanthomonas campestris pv. campestris]MEA0665756.1 class I SAM-dependent methyltransferase [Xanthomon
MSATNEPLARRGRGVDASQLLETQRAFDSVAADYDGPRGNNALIQRMRTTLWDTVATELPVGSRLVDLGCGTGLDAGEFASRGYSVLATDWSPAMVARTRERAARQGLEERLTAAHVGIQQLERLEGEFDGMYSNFGPLNCAPDLPAVAAECARLLRPDGCLVFSVIGRICPWEVGHYALRGRFKRAAVRAAQGATAVGMNGHTIWTWYHLPREFYRTFSQHFVLDRYQALSLFLPPPYLVDFYERHPRLSARLGQLDDRMGGWPLLRDMGDHFLIVMRKR